MMRSVAGQRLLLPAVAVLALSGCYSYSPYGYPGGYGAPGAVPYQQAPIQTLTPGQQYTPGMSVPQGTPPTYFDGGGGLQPIPDSNPGGGAPPSGSGSGNMVPDPYFPSSGNSTYQFHSPAAPGNGGIQPAQHFTEPAPLQQMPGNLREVGSQPVQTASPANPPLDGSSSGTYSPPPAHQPPAEANSFSSNQEEYFAPPRNLDEPAENPFGAQQPRPEPAGAMPVFDMRAHKVSQQEIRPFGHGPEYQWLRGVVSREPQDGTWCIVYSDDPSAEDQLAGHVTLAPSAHLQDLKEGDIVEIRGEVDPLDRDALGKPVYLVSSLNRLLETRE